MLREKEKKKKFHRNAYCTANMWLTYKDRIKYTSLGRGPGVLTVSTYMDVDTKDFIGWQREKV